jgi:hypothetical protein
MTHGAPRRSSGRRDHVPELVQFFVDFRVAAEAAHQLQGFHQLLACRAHPILDFSETGAAALTVVQNDVFEPVGGSAHGVTEAHKTD